MGRYISKFWDSDTQTWTQTVAVEQVFFEEKFKFQFANEKFHGAKEKGKQTTNLGNQLKKLKGNLDEDNLSKHNRVKKELEEIYDHIAVGTRIANRTGINMANNRRIFFLT